MESLFLLGKILFGGYFILSGWGHFKNLEGMTGYAKSKKVPMPKAAVIVGGLFIMLGGLGILSAMYVKLSVALIVVFLLAASFMIHNYWADKDPQTKAVNKINFLKNMALIGAALMMLSIPNF